MSSLEIRVCGRYRLEEKIYMGKYSSVYIGKNVQSDTQCAIKCQQKSKNPSFVLNEGKVLENLQGGVGIPHLVWYGENGDFRFLVTELLGNNLQEYLDICGGKFSLKTTLMITQKILSSIQFIHYKNYVHRDIKPANFVMGLGKKLHQIFTIDHAFSTYYTDMRTKQHRQNVVDEEHFVGTLKFASLNVHNGRNSSRRDDLQSIGLMMIYFLKGTLPWSDANGQNLKEKRKNIRKIMQETPVSKLCQQLPKQIQQYMEYVRSLKFDDIPDYNYLRRILKEKFIKEGFQFDYIYDWILIPLKLKDTRLSNRIPLNRFTKKEDSSLSMCNFEYNFEADFQLNNIKVEQIQKKQEQEIPKRTARVISNNEGAKQQPRKKPATATGLKKQKKQDCSTF